MLNKTTLGIGGLDFKLEDFIGQVHFQWYSCEEFVKTSSAVGILATRSFNYCVTKIICSP